MAARLKTSSVSDLNTAATTNGVSTNVGAYFAKFGSTTSNKPGSAGIVMGFYYTANSEV